MAEMEGETVRREALQVHIAPDLVRGNSSRDKDSPDSSRHLKLKQTPSASETMEIIMSTVPGTSSAGRQSKGNSQTELRSRRKPSVGADTDASNGSNDESGTSKFQKIHHLRNLGKGLLFASIVILLILLTIQLTRTKSFIDDALKASTEEELHLMGFRYKQKFISTTASIVALSSDPSINLFLSGNTSLISEVERLVQSESQYAKVSLVLLLDSNKTIVASSGGSRYGDVYDPLGMVSKIYSAGYVEDLTVDPLFVSAIISSSEFFSLNGTEMADGTWSLMARQSLSVSGQQVGLGQYCVLPLFNDQQKLLGSIVSLHLLTGNLDMVQELMEVFQDGYVGIFVKENGTVYSVAHALYQDQSELNLNWRIPSNEINSIANSILADSSADLVPKTTTYVTSEYGTMFLSALRTEGWQRLNNISSEHRSSTFLVRGTYSTVLDSDFYSLNAQILALSTGFVIFNVMAMFSAIQYFIDPLEKLVRYVKAGKMDKYGEILAKIMSRKRFVFVTGAYLLIATGFLIAIVPVSISAAAEITTQLTQYEEEFQGLLFSYSSKMHTLVSYFQISRHD
jgi:hypothetical protein